MRLWPGPDPALNKLKQLTWSDPDLLQVVTVIPAQAGIHNSLIYQRTGSESSLPPDYYLGNDQMRLLQEALFKSVPLFPENLPQPL